jgi:hypothetical protein
MTNASIKATCHCNFPFVETGYSYSGDPNSLEGNDAPTLSLFISCGIMIFTNRPYYSSGLLDMDDNDLRCTRCGKIARWLS